MFVTKLRNNIFTLAIIIVVLVLNESTACFFTDEYQSISIAAGSPFYHECRCQQPGYSVENLRWLDIHNQPIDELRPGTNSYVYTELQGDSINLHIPNVSKMLSGTYKCVAEFDGKQFSQMYKVDAYFPLFFMNTHENQYIQEGQSSTVKCEARGESTPLISWHWEHDGLTEIKGSEKYEMTPEGLIINNVTKEDGGNYTCTALVMETGEEVEKYIQVEVITEPKILELRVIPQTTVVRGENLTIECIAEGTPQPEYFWNKTSDNEESGGTWRTEVNAINFDSIQENDRGTYECYVKNLAGETRQHISLEVLIPPEIVEFDNITAPEGSLVHIYCNATGRSVPNISIAYEGTELIEDGKEVSLDIIPNFSVLKVNRSHAGIYICNASNEVDFDTKEMYMTILHRPYFEETEQLIWGWNGKTVNLSCLHESNPTANISWRYQVNDIPTKEQVEVNKILLEKLNSIPEYFLPITIDNTYYYGIYTCTAKNSIGQNTKIISLKEGFTPQAVKNVSVLDITATSVMFTIEEPQTIDGPEVIGFTAQYDESENYNITNIHINRTWSKDRPYKLDKLKPNTTYFVKFAAVNEVGAGIWSDTLVFDTLEKSVPDIPIWETEPLQILTDDNKVLKWKTPDDNGDPIDYYALRFCLENPESEEKLCREERISSTELELNDLDYNTTYYLELVAHNSQGNSTSANISITVPESAIKEEGTNVLSGGVIIGIAVIVVILCLLLLDLLLLFWRHQGIIALCCYKKDNKRKQDNLASRDKKGLLKDNGDASAGDVLRRPNNGHNEYEYNKVTGVITGKHSAV